MRTIKFRAWDKKKKVMLNNEDTLNLLAYFVKNVEYMQFTGLKDKNGKEIYEGDIISEDFIMPPIYMIEFIKGVFMFKRTDGNGSYPIYDNIIKKDKLLSVKILGNIYENPELMKR